MIRVPSELMRLAVRPSDTVTLRAKSSTGSENADYGFEASGRLAVSQTWLDGLSERLDRCCERDARGVDRADGGADLES